MSGKLLMADTGWWCDHMDGWDAGGWVMMIGMILFWTFVVVAIIWLIRSAPWVAHQHPHESPLEVLDRRFAAGELSVEEYRERRSLLQDGKAGPP